MRSRNSWIGLLAAVVVVAAAVGGLFLVRAVGEDEIVLPERIGDLMALDSADAYPGEPPSGALDRARRNAAVSADGYADALDGATAASRTYLEPGSADSDLTTVVAVAGDLGPLVPPSGFVDAEELGFALPPVERVTDDDVECLLFRSAPPRAGTDYQPDQAAPDSQTCQRRSGTLTVRVQTTSPDQDAVVGLVDDLYDDLD